MTKYRIAIQAYQGTKPVEFENIMINSRKSIKTIKKIIKETIN